MIIALIGSPLAGKTTLLKELQKNNIKIFSADLYIKNIYKVGQEGYEIIKNEIGKEFVNENEVDRKKLSEWAIVSDNLKKLNELIHPLIKKYLDGKDNFVAELPILTNSYIKFKYDKVILVKASPETIVKRFEKANIKNPLFITKILKDWENLDFPFDFIVDTTNNIKKEDIINIIKLINE